jgi:hypothetical protein
MKNEQKLQELNLSPIGSEDGNKPSIIIVPPSKEQQSA